MASLPWNYQGWPITGKPSLSLQAGHGPKDPFSYMWAVWKTDRVCPRCRVSRVTGAQVHLHVLSDPTVPGLWGFEDRLCAVQEGENMPTLTLHI